MWETVPFHRCLPQFLSTHKRFYIWPCRSSIRKWSLTSSWTWDGIWLKSMLHHFLCLFIFYVFFKIIFYWLCYCSCPNFSLFAPLHPAPPTPSSNLHTMVMSIGPVYKFFGYSLSYTTLHPPGYSVTTYLYFFIPFPLHPFPTPPSHLATIKMRSSVSMTLSLFFLFG